MKKVLALASLAALALPAAALAASNTINNISDVGSFIINTINNIIVPVLFAVAFIVFLIGAFQTFIAGAQSTDVKERGKNLMLWGLIGFFVMVSIWGLVNILTGTIGFSNNANITGGTPTAPGIQ
jgi:hypothetical protein